MSPSAELGRSWARISAPAPYRDRTTTAAGEQLDYNNVVVVEDEKNSPWTPFHVQKGFKPEENVVSLFDGWDLRHGHGAKGAGAIMPKFDEQIGSMFATHDPNVQLPGDPRSLDGASCWLSRDTTPRRSSRTGCGRIRLSPRRSTANRSWLTCGCIRARWQAKSLMPPGGRRLTIPRSHVGRKPMTLLWSSLGARPMPCFQVGNMNYIGRLSIDKWM